MTKSFFSVDICSLIMVIIILNNSKKIIHFKKSDSFFTMILSILGMIFIADLFCWMLIGRPNSTARTIAIIMNLLYFLLSGIVPYLWLRYVYCKLHDDKDMDIEVAALASIPMVFLMIITLMTPFTHALFKIDENGVYCRGTFLAVHYIIVWGYGVIATVWSVWEAHKQCSKEKKKEYLYLGMFVVIPIMGSIIQTLDADIVLVWPCTALSALMIYIQFNNREISMDSLTGLNNRGCFNRFLMEQCEAADEDRKNKNVFLSLIDINDFKIINDKYGHNVGDIALIKTAQVLKCVFGDTKAFLARYGGDEFAIVNIFEKESEIEELLEELNRQLEVGYEMGDIPCKIQLSFGTARYGTCDTYSVEQLLVEADKNMYAKKIEMKKEQEEKNGEKNQLDH